MGKTSDLTAVQKTTIDTLYKEGKTQKVIAKEAGCSQSSVSKHINRQAKGLKKCGRKKCTSSRDNRTLQRIVTTNPFKNVGEIHKEWTAAGVSASRTTTKRLMKDMGFRCRIPCVKPLLNKKQRSVSPGPRTKRTGLLLSGPKLCFLMKVHLAFPFEIKTPESGGRKQRHMIHIRAWIADPGPTVPDRFGHIFRKNAQVWVTLEERGRKPPPPCRLYESSHSRPQPKRARTQEKEIKIN